MIQDRLRAMTAALVLCAAGCTLPGPGGGPSAGLAPAGVDPGSSGGFSDAGSFGWGPYGDPGFGESGFIDGFGDDDFY